MAQEIWGEFRILGINPGLSTKMTPDTSGNIELDPELTKNDLEFELEPPKEKEQVDP